MSIVQLASTPEYQHRADQQIIARQRVVIHEFEQEVGRLRAERKILFSEGFVIGVALVGFFAWIL